MKNALYLVLFSLISLTISAQRSDFNTRFVEANQLMTEKYWTKSIDVWKELLAQDDMNANLNYKIGFCYLNTANMANRKEEALKHLKKAAEGTVNMAYDPYDPAEKRVPVEAMFWLGRAYHLNYELDKAIETYEKVISTVPAKHNLRPKAEREIEMCREAKKQRANPKNFIISNIGSVINGATNEYSPVINLRGDALFFTSRRLRPDNSNQTFTEFDTGEWREDVYVSYQDRDGNWLAPELLNINTDKHTATISTSVDGQKLYIYMDEGGNGQIYESVLVGETWSKPELLGSDINTAYWETHITVSSDEKVLYFVSNRPGGLGGRDIYRCVKLPNGEWSKALNVGPNINSEFDEDAPFLAPDGKTLYFSSMGHNSMGGFDIFRSILGEDGEWSKPENMGYPLNTVDDDVFFVPTGDGRRAYYSSDKLGGYGLKDIYVLELAEPIQSDLSVLKGYIFPPENEKLPPQTFLLVTNQKSGEVSEYRPRMRDGAYVAILPPCLPYKIEYFAANELVHEEFINVPCESGYREIEKEIFLLPVYLDGFKKYEVKIDDPIKLGAGTKDKPEVVVYDDKIGMAEFERYFIYDFHEFERAEGAFLEFINNTKKIIDKKGKAEIFIESSASKVPSTRFKSNQELTKHRFETCKAQILQELKESGYKEDQVKFVTPKTVVQGPEYKGDALTNKAVYEQFQYVKARAK
jgi:hypothetical protein